MDRNSEIMFLFDCTLVTKYILDSANQLNQYSNSFTSINFIQNEINYGWVIHHPYSKH